MKNYEYKKGVTLLEILVVVAIIALLVSTVISIATRIDNQSKERLTEGTFALLDAALDQFHDYEYNYNELSDYVSFDFPLDCNGFSEDILRSTLGEALGTSFPAPIVNHDPNYSGSEVLYFFLSRVPESLKTLDKIDSSLIISDGVIITVDGKRYPLLRIIDPWGTTLRYDYYEDWVDYQVTYGGNWILYLSYIEKSKRTFPIITSAGPDRIFGTVDDMSSR